MRYSWIDFPSHHASTLVQIWQRYPTNTNLMSKHKKLLLILHDLIFREELLSYSTLSEGSHKTELVVCYLMLWTTSCFKSITFWFHHFRHKILNKVDTFYADWVNRFWNTTFFWRPLRPAVKLKRLNLTFSMSTRHLQAYYKVEIHHLFSDTIQLYFNLNAIDATTQA